MNPLKQFFNTKFHCCDFINVGLLSQKSSKLVIFRIYLPLMENPGFINNLNIGAKLKTVLYPMAP